MKKRPERRQRTQAGNGASAELAFLVEPMPAAMATTREHLLAWVHAHGLAALDELFRDEAAALAGPKGRHQAARTYHHWGTTGTELTFGGRRLQVQRPRVRGTDGREATLPSVAAFRQRDPLSARMMQQVWCPRGSTRRVWSRGPRTGGPAGAVRARSAGRWSAGPGSGCRGSWSDGGRGST
jgi:hypothetical protein